MNLESFFCCWCERVVAQVVLAREQPFWVNYSKKIVLDKKRKKKEQKHRGGLFYISLLLKETAFVSDLSWRIFHSIWRWTPHYIRLSTLLLTKLFFGFFIHRYNSIFDLLFWDKQNNHGNFRISTTFWVLMRLHYLRQKWWILFVFYGFLLSSSDGV